MRSEFEFFLSKLDSEKAHIAARQAFHRAEQNPWALEQLARRIVGKERFSDPRLTTQIGDVTLGGIGVVAAGWDKVGESLKFWDRMGAAAVVVGTVLAWPQEGNPKPRQFHKEKPQSVTLNRLGFNSPGMYVVKENLAQYGDSGLPIWASVGRNKEPVLEKFAPETHALVIETLYPNVDIFELGISSPNTPGMRGSQAKKPFTDIVVAVNETMESLGGKKPLLVKLAPDLDSTQLDDVLDVVHQHGLVGVALSNTTTDPALKERYGFDRNEAGGLSGDMDEYRAQINGQIKHVRKVADRKLIIVGIGGIHDGPTTLDAILYGANLIGMVNGIRQEGPGVFDKINRYIANWMTKNGVPNLDEIRGQKSYFRG